MNEKTTCDILIRNTSILDENFQIRRNIFIAIQNGIILSITEKEPSGLTVTKIIDGKDLLWMPGLVDGHMHTGQQLLKGAVLDELPMIWTRIMLPFESTLTPEKMRLSASLAALEMIKNGTTGFVDAGSYFMEEAARIYLTSGLRGALSLFFHFFYKCRKIREIFRIPSARPQWKFLHRKTGFLMNFMERVI